MTTIAEPLNALDLFALEALDFTPELPCEGTLHGKAAHHEGPAAYLIQAKGGCPKCGAVFDSSWAICKPAWAHAGAFGLSCSTDACSQRFPRNEVWSIKAVL